MSDEHRDDLPDLDLDKDEVITGYSTAPFDVAELEQMLAKDPDNEMLLDIAAFKYYTSGLLNKALDSYLKLVKINYEKAVYHFYLGNTYFKLGRHLKAIEEWETTMHLDHHGSCGRKAAQRLHLLDPSAR